MDYEILDPQGKQLNKAVNQYLDLKQTLPAFTHGMQGMKIGETRKLLIHPSLAYGVHTLLDKGIYLTVIVKLISINDSTKHALPSIQPIDLSYILDQNFHAECEEKYKRSLKFAGHQKREFLQQCPNVDLDKIANVFQSPEASSPLTREESNMLHSLFWNIYFSPSPSNK